MPRLLLAIKALPNRRLITMKPRPLTIATLAERVKPGRTVYPPKLATRGISKQPWTAIEHGRESLLIRRINAHRQIHHSTKVLVLVSEDPNLA